MQSDRAAVRRPRQANSIGLVLVLLSLADVCLRTCQAQLEFNGGYVQTHREDHGQVPSLASEPKIARSPAKTLFSYFPDHDFYYSSFFLAPTFVARSDDNARSASALSDFPLSLPSGLPINVRASALPWNQVGFKGYDNPQGIARNPTLRFSLVTTPLPPATLKESTESALLIAHLPEHAVFWVEGARTRSTGRTRFFQSPPLLPGRKYQYRLRAAWIENGEWVSQSQTIPVQAGVIQAVYLQSR